MSHKTGHNLVIVFGTSLKALFIQHALHVPSPGLPLLSPFSWPMNIATTKANEETTYARNAA